MVEIGHIAGADQLVAVFGRWPSFHDAEVVWVRLDRGTPGDGVPSLEALVHTSEMTSEVGAGGYYVLRHHVLVHLRFGAVTEARLDGFNEQNVLTALNLTDRGEGQPESSRFEVSFDPAFGLGASFQCDAIEVVSVAPCGSDGQPLPPDPTALAA